MSKLEDFSLFVKTDGIPTATTPIDLMIEKGIESFILISTRFESKTFYFCFPQEFSDDFILGLIFKDFFMYNFREPTATEASEFIIDIKQQLSNERGIHD